MRRVLVNLLDNSVRALMRHDRNSKKIVITVTYDGVRSRLDIIFSDNINNEFLVYRLSAFGGFPERHYLLIDPDNKSYNQTIFSTVWFCVTACLHIMKSEMKDTFWELYLLLSLFSLVRQKLNKATFSHFLYLCLHNLTCTFIFFILFMCPLNKLLHRYGV